MFHIRFIAKVQKVANGLGVHIPQHYLDGIDVKKGMEVTVVLEVVE